MTRLARDRRGNVMAMSAIALFPLLAMIGGAIDASRIYMAYTRLQQACDSGALAGRKAMSNIKTLSTSEKAKANEFFDFNFPTDTYKATNIVRNYAKGEDGVVVGNASIVMPTTIMKMFGYDTVPLSVGCEATLNIPNTDVMFVLDVTGSMDDTASGDTMSKINGLKQAVKDFYAALGPGNESGPGRVRYGFVPYSMNVNVGRILYKANPTFMVGGTGPENHNYQSRQANTVTENYVESYGAESAQKYDEPYTSQTFSWSGWSNTGSDVGSYPATYANLTSSQCSAKAAPSAAIARGNFGSPSNTSDENVQYPDNEQDRNYSSAAYSGTETEYRYDRNGNTCRLQSRTRRIDSKMNSKTVRPVNWAQRERFTSWSYVQRSIDVSSFVQSTDPVANPAYWSGYYTGANPNGLAPAAFAWGGCIEEADTVNDIRASSSLTASSNAYDLQIDLIPDSTATRWRPYLKQLQFERDGTWLGASSGDLSACPREASKLTQYTDYVALTKSSANFNSYVDSLTAVGFTYHDIGLIWGARFLSQDGIFAAENSDAAAPGGYQVSRHIVFMTDGALNTLIDNNDAWGINNLDGRIAPTNSNKARVDESHRRRIQIICNSMKSKNFTVWVIGFGISTLPNELKQCASDDSHWAVAKKSDDLRKEFAKIAQTIGGLRLSS